MWKHQDLMDKLLVGTLSRTGIPTSLLAIPGDKAASRRPDPRIRQRIQLGTIRPIRVDHTIFFKWRYSFIPRSNGQNFCFSEYFFSKDSREVSRISFVLILTWSVYFFCPHRGRVGCPSIVTNRSHELEETSSPVSDLEHSR